MNFHPNIVISPSNMGEFLVTNKRQTMEIDSSYMLAKSVDDKIYIATMICAIK